MLEHSADDTSRLLLSRGKWQDVDVNAAVTAIECRRKIRTKLPEWYAEAGIVYPDRICAEQSSSSGTAAYKAEVARRIIASGKADGASECAGRIADLTGGLGVDSLAFSRVASEVLYNEMAPERAEAARHNFPLLGARNVKVISHCVQPGAGEPSLEPGDFWNILRDFRPDLIYMDPARRSSTGSKVFLLEDCSPDVLTLLPDIFCIVPDLLLKLSPMADISMLVRRLEERGAGVVEVHIVASAGECKELLLWVRNGKTQGTALIVNEDEHILSFPASSFGQDSEPSGAEQKPLFMEAPEQLRSMQYLFEPGKALAKAGLFNAVCTMFSGASTASCLLKAGRSTHLYFFGNVLREADDVPKPCSDKDIDIRDFGKVFRILEVEPLCKQSIKAFSVRYPKAEVSARNIPMTSDELRKRLKVASGGGVHIFGLRVDFLSAPSANFLIAVSRA